MKPLKTEHFNLSKIFIFSENFLSCLLSHFHFFPIVDFDLVCLLHFFQNQQLLKTIDSISVWKKIILKKMPQSKYLR